VKETDENDHHLTSQMMTPYHHRHYPQHYYSSPHSHHHDHHLWLLPHHSSRHAWWHPVHRQHSISCSSLPRSIELSQHVLVFEMQVGVVLAVLHSLHPSPPHCRMWAGLAADYAWVHHYWNESEHVTGREGQQLMMRVHLFHFAFYSLYFSMVRFHPIALSSRDFQLSSHSHRCTLPSLLLMQSSQ